MDIVIATHNAKKRAELARILGPLGYNMLDATLPEVDETGATFEENARLKALSGCRASGLTCIADDSGLCVDALNGAPGVDSAIFAGTHGNDAANTAKLLNLMQNVEISARTARFVCVTCCIFPDSREIYAHGTCEGSIAQEPAGEGGFGYDPVFLPAEASGHSMAQLTAAQKDAISHRGRALAQLAIEMEKHR